MTAIGRIRIAVLAATFALTLVAVPGCSMWPSDEEIAAADAKLDDAIAQLDKAKAEMASMQAALEKVENAKAVLLEKEKVLNTIQARIALDMANASPDARPILEAQYDAVRQQAIALRDNIAGTAAAIGDYTRQLAEWQVEVDSLTQAVALREQTMQAMADRIEASNEGVKSALKGVVGIVGNFVPGVSAVADPAIDNVLTPLLGLTTLGMAGTNWYQRRKGKAVTEERDGARRVIAITEKVGMANIVNDPNAKAKAKELVAADTVASRELALGRVTPIT